MSWGVLLFLQILSSSKVLSEDIAAKQEIASATEQEIDKVFMNISAELGTCYLFPRHRVIRGPVVLLADYRQDCPSSGINVVPVATLPSLDWCEVVLNWWLRHLVFPIL